MLTAISGGVTAPMFSPMGACTFATRRGTPSRCNCSKIVTILRLDPINPMYRAFDPTTAAISGRRGGGRAYDDDIGIIADHLSGELILDLTDHALGAGESLGRCQVGPVVDHHDAKAGCLRYRGKGFADVASAGDDECRAG